MITATFSNGFTDTYKGTRPIKAAWAIILTSTGQTLLSGHSLDAVKAASTAEGNFSRVAHKALGRNTVGDPDRPHSMSFSCSAWHNKIAKENGFASWKAAYEAYRADLAAARALVKIEVVNL